MTTPYGFDEKSAQRIAKVVRQVERQGPDGGGPPTGRGKSAEPFWAKLNGESASTPGDYKWKMERVSAGALADTSPLVQDTSYSAREVNARPGLPVGTMARLYFVGFDGSGNPRYLFAANSIPGQLFRVDLAQTGGGNGTQTTAATWTYTATSLAGATLGTALAPERARPNGTRAAATKGVGYYGAGGAFVLAEAWETASTGHC